ncbi:GntR family transcriptional regulator [Caproicibacter sp.]|uniref:GntR family transcriptional regulator n=1 Tax=Caproicibacter sp. TaxID=2814884 RepID=UPI00398A2D27
MSENSLKEKAYKMIKEKIVSCEYLPNTFLNENILQKEIGVSRTPIRDAIGRLEQENLVRILPKKGIVVSDLSINEISSIYEVRLLIEPFAIEGYADKIDKATILNYKNYYSQNNSFENIDEVYQVDDEIHHIFISATQNKYLIQTYDNIQVQNRRIRILSGKKIEERMERSNQEHIRILDAVLSDQFEQAARHMTEHLQNAKKAAFSLILSNGGWDYPSVNAAGSPFLPQNSFAAVSRHLTAPEKKED